MKDTLKNSLFVSFAVGFCFIVLASIGFAGDSGIIQPEDHLGSESSKTSIKQKYSYRYYPSCAVYYDIRRKLYYYPEDDNWKISTVLPGNLKRKLGDYVKIATDKDKPYIDNEKHVKNILPKIQAKQAITSGLNWSSYCFTSTHPDKIDFLN